MTRRTFWCNVVGVLLGLLVVALIDRRTVVALDAKNSSVYPNPVHNGSEILITWKAIPHRNCAGVVIPRVIDSSGRIFEYARTPTVYQNLMRPGEGSFTKTLTLPLAMAPLTSVEFDAP